MKVSIVTISYNQARFLEQTIKSVLNQDYPNIEYIVVDPGSTDGSREIIEKYRDRIAHVIFEPDRGPADGLNKGFSLAKGDIYAYLNSDDLLMPGAVSHFVSLFAKYDVDVISGHGYKIDDTGKIIGKTFSHLFDPVAFVFGACILIQQSTFCRAEIFKQVGGFNIDNKISWDGELWFDMALSGARFKRVDGYWSCFRMHSESITVSGKLAYQEAAVMKRLAARIGIPPDDLSNPFRYRWHWLRTRVMDPVTMLKRVYEAL